MMHRQQKIMQVIRQLVDSADDTTDHSAEQAAAQKVIDLIQCDRYGRIYQMPAIKR